MGIIDAVNNAARVRGARKTSVKASFRADSNVLHRPTSATEIPDLYAAISTSRGEDRVGATARLETDLFEGCGVVTQDRNGLLRYKVQYFTCLVTRSCGKKQVIVGEGHVNDGVAMCLERHVDLGELILGVQQTHIPFLVTYSNNTLGFGVVSKRNTLVHDTS